MSSSRGHYVEGEDRTQALLLPEVLDDYVGQEDEVRFVDGFVETLDLARLGFTHSEPNDEGRPPYDPKDMLKLYVWGYLNGVRSSRKLERECHRNLELLWLMKKLSPDFRTIADFRKDNVDRIKSVFKEFVAFLQDIDLVESKLVSLDGTKVKAVNARKRTFTPDYVVARLKRVEERVRRYLEELEKSDEAEDEDEDDEERELIKKRNGYLRAKLEKLRKSKEELEEVQKKLMNESGGSGRRKEISLTDPESRLMKNNGKYEVCYNAEVSVDAKKHMIVNYDVTNEANDQEQLAPMAKGTKDLLGVEKLDVTADNGFANMPQIKDCIENGITPYLPSSKLDGSGTSWKIPDPVNFGKDRFVYQKERDVYICPAGHELAFKYIEMHRGNNLRRAYMTDACRACPFMARCTNCKRGRFISRWEHQDIIDELLEKTRREPEKLEQRMNLAEHPFGTIKRAFNQGYFLLKGLRKVNGEMGLTVIAFDMRRALNILGTRRLLKALAGITRPRSTRVGLAGPSRR